MQTLLAVSEAAGTATTDATEYARRLAVRDALIAARNAARTGSSWITISSYGAGAAPVFDGASTQNIGVDLSGPAKTYKGGWKVDALEIKNYLWVGIRAEAASPLYAARGLWLTSTLNVHDIGGLVFNTTPPYTYNFVAGSTMFCAQGAGVVGVVNADVSGTYNSCDLPTYVHLCPKSVVDGSTALHSHYISAYMDGADTQLWQNCTYDSMCDGPGLSTGSSAMLVSTATDVIVYNVEAKNTPVRTQDGSAMDFEASVINGLFLACNFHDNGDAPIELLANPGQEQGTMIVGCTLTNNGIGYATNTHGAGVFINYANPDTLNHILFVNNTITRPTSPAQTSIFSSRNTVLTNTVTTIWTNGIFGPDNTVI